jgi:hypothetical protein
MNEVLRQLDAFIRAREAQIAFRECLRELDDVLGVFVSPEVDLNKTNVKELLQNDI